MRIKISLETIVCLALLALGVAAYLTVGMAEPTASPFLLRQERSMGSLDYKSMPQIYAIALACLCAANLALRRLKRNKPQEEEEKKTCVEPVVVPPERTKVVLFRTWATAVLVTVYALLLPYLPFMAATAVFLFAMCVVYGQTNMLKVVPASLIGTVCLWLLFIKLASLPLGRM